MIKTRFVTSLGALVAASSASAQPPEEPYSEPSTHEGRRTAVTALVGTDVGVDFAVGLQVELPMRLRLTGTVGWTPHAYSWVVGKAYEEINDGADATSEVLEDLLAGAFVARFNVGYRPLRDRGMFVAAGGTFQTAEKNSLLASAIESSTGRELPGSGEGMRRFSTEADLYLVDGRVGWEWGLGTGFLLQAAAGISVVVHSTTELEPLYMPADPALTEAFLDDAESTLEDAGKGMIGPEATLFLGYTF